MKLKATVNHQTTMDSDKPAKTRSTAAVRHTDVPYDALDSKAVRSWWSAGICHTGVADFRSKRATRAQAASQEIV
jgi:hypothetical protein